MAPTVTIRCDRILLEGPSIDEGARERGWRTKPYYDVDSSLVDVHASDGAAITTDGAGQASAWT